MKRRSVIIVALAFLCICLSLVSGCATSAQTGAAIGGIGGAVIGGVTGGAGGVLVGGAIGAGGGYIVGNEMDK